MEDSPVLFCKQCTPWHGLLLTACLLTSWHLSTTSNVTIESVPLQVIEGENVLFLVHNLPEKLTAFSWFRGLTDIRHGIAVYTLYDNLSAPGPLHSGRETVYHNGSLLLKNVTKNDIGIYTLRTYNKYGKIITTTSMYLYVHAFLWNCGRLATSEKPTIESVPPSVAEGKSVLLLVRNLPENIVGFVWFKGTTVPNNIVVDKYIIDKSTTWGPGYGGRETLFNDGSLLLQDVTQKDSGLYILRVLRTDMRSQDAKVQLQVHTSSSLFCNPLSSSQLMIQPVTEYPAEGEGILLQVHNLPEDLQAFSWYKSKDRTKVLKIVEYNRVMNFISWGPKHRRGMVYNNGSLMLQTVTEKDTGIYTLSVLKKDFKIDNASTEFYVKKNVSQPFVQITDTTVAGRRSVIFSCISPDTNIYIRWLFNNKNLKLTERMTLSPTKCGLRIDPVRSQDAGEYQCEVSNKFSVKTSLPVSWS